LISRGTVQNRATALYGSKELYAKVGSDVPDKRCILTEPYDTPYELNKAVNQVAISQIRRSVLANCAVSSATYWPKSTGYQFWLDSPSSLAYL